MTNQEKVDIQRKVDEALELPERDYGEFPDLWYREGRYGEMMIILTN